MSIGEDGLAENSRADEPQPEVRPAGVMHQLCRALVRPSCNVATLAAAGLGMVRALPTMPTNAATFALVFSGSTRRAPGNFGKST